eukprot:5357703-Prymnesium_polylepis.1
MEKGNLPRDPGKISDTLSCRGRSPPSSQRWDPPEARRPQHSLLHLVTPVPVQVAPTGPTGELTVHCLQGRIRPRRLPTPQRGGDTSDTMYRVVSLYRVHPLYRLYR